VSEGSSQPATTLTDPVALRAFAHPTRLNLVGLLRLRGPLTATQAAELTGESVASCSFHLRQLAKYGLVEPAAGGRGREKPWRATGMATTWPTGTGDPALDAAGREFGLTVARSHAELVACWLRTEHTEPPAWREAASVGDMLGYLTAPELTGVLAALDDALRPYQDRLSEPASRPPDARPVVIMRTAVPVPSPDDQTSKNGEDENA
jgi:DNA-binding transcriptional ArsR family regulator